MITGSRDIARDALPYLIERMLHASPERREVLAAVVVASVPAITRSRLPLLLGCILRAPSAQRRALVAALLFDAVPDDDDDVPDYRHRSLPC